eukprot:2224869-Pyramimonas_sp.AAC.1
MIRRLASTARDTTAPGHSAFEGEETRHRTHHLAPSGPTSSCPSLGKTSCSTGALFGLAPGLNKT